MIQSLIFERKIQSENEFNEIVELVKKNIETDSILLLDGELGSGKTTFTKYFCDSFQLKLVQSPTYSIHQRYQNEIITIDHFDLYRLESMDEIDSTGFWDLLQNKNNFILVEWSNRINNQDWPLDRGIFRLVIKINEFNHRNIQLFKINF